MFQTLFGMILIRTIKKVKGKMSCCWDDFCNNNWIQEYRNLTKEVVEENLIPRNTTLNEQRRKIYVETREIYLRKQDAPVGIPNFKSYQEEQERKYSVSNWNLWMLFGVIGFICLLSFIGAMTILSLDRGIFTHSEIFNRNWAKKRLRK